MADGTAPRDGSVADVRVDKIVSRRADVASIDKSFLAALSHRISGLVSVRRGSASVASNELPIPIAIAMAVGRKQPVFVVWLRAVNDMMNQALDADQAAVYKAGR